MEYEVRFYNDDGVLQHTIEKQDLFDFSISEKGMGSINSFNSEPQRVEFSVFKTEWIESYLLPVQYQSERNISIYYMNIFDSGNIILNCYIDLSSIDNDDKTELVTITGYTFDGLLNIFSDLNATSVLHQGTTLVELIESYANAIEGIVGFNLHVFDYYDNNAVIESVSNIQVKRKDINAAGSSSPHTTVVAGFSLVYSEDLGMSNYYYFKSTDKNSQNEDDEWYVSSRRIEIYRIMLPLQFAKVEDITIHREYADGLSGSDDIITLLTLYLGSGYNLYGLAQTINWGSYRSMEIVAGYIIFNGSLFPYNGDKYFLGLSLESSDRPVWTSAGSLTYYNAMKALTLASNHIIINKKVSENSYGGGVQISPRPDTSQTPVVIDDEDIISSKRYYFPKIDAPLSDLDALAGDIRTYKEQMLAYYNNFHEAKRGRVFTIDQMDKYDIDALNIITVKSINYQIYSIEPNRDQDEYYIIGWEI